LSSHTENESFDFFNVFDWLLVLATAAGFFALILVAILHYRIRTMMILLAASSRVQALPTLPHFSYVVTSPVTPNNTYFYNPMAFHQFVEEILPVDLTLLFALVFFIIAFFGYLFYRYKRARRARTTLILEIGNDENSLQFF